MSGVKSRTQAQTECHLIVCSAFTRAAQKAKEEGEAAEAARVQAAEKAAAEAKAAADEAKAAAEAAEKALAEATAVRPEVVHSVAAEIVAVAHEGEIGERLKKVGARVGAMTCSLLWNNQDVRSESICTLDACCSPVISAQPTLSLTHAAGMDNLGSRLALHDTDRRTYSLEHVSIYISVAS